ncbi:class F sortase [Streptomyces sp. NBC_01190]|uniref:class F sortase n=1 Tax=Streptomyces sp. NBC_01190 TaxID=2903767 RepID=UPI00386F8404|nr:class F sortase [Streptomyces sp. NBC_01190]
MTSQSPQRDTPVRDPRSRVIRWAVAGVLVGGFLMYNSLTHAEGQAPVTSGVYTAQPAPAAAVPGSGPAAGPLPAAPSTATGTAAAAPSDATAMTRSEPTLLSIPDIGVHAPFTKLALGSDGRLQAPPPNNTNLVGWYGAGPTPGETGDAIVAGHVDTKTGPAVFVLLSLLKPGEKVSITRADASVAHFTIDSVETFDKDKFPDQRVYGNTPDAQLRIITCGGTFDRKKQDYKDNVVVFAHLDKAGKR